MKPQKSTFLVKTSVYKITIMAFLVSITAYCKERAKKYVILYGNKTQMFSFMNITSVKRQTTNHALVNFLD